ncbi:MAG: hypothetical protein QF752_00965 [Planctomycetota bacterium]|nr:hypothetical protein [Planctomycetota bacterium]
MTSPSMSMSVAQMTTQQVQNQVELAAQTRLMAKQLDLKEQTARDLFQSIGLGLRIDLTA